MICALCGACVLCALCSLWGMCALCFVLFLGPVCSVLFVGPAGPAGQVGITALCGGIEALCGEGQVGITALHCRIRALQPSASAPKRCLLAACVVGKHSLRPLHQTAILYVHLCSITHAHTHAIRSHMHAHVRATWHARAHPLSLLQSESCRAALRPCAPVCVQPRLRAHAHAPTLLQQNTAKFARRAPLCVRLHCAGPAFDPRGHMHPPGPMDPFSIVPLSHPRAAGPHFAPAPLVSEGTAQAVCSDKGTEPANTIG